MIHWNPTLLMVAAGLTGMVVGSFINVCIYRLPMEESVAYPPSHCPACGKTIKAYDLIPILSYLLLKGRCRFCREKISLRYPVVEFSTGFLFAILFVKFGFTLILAKYAVFASILIVISFIDLEHYIIPDRAVLAGLVAGVLLHPLAGDITALSSFYGIFSASGFLLFVYFISPLIFKQEGMGWGDVKLSLVMGLFLGWPLSMLAVFVACCLAGLMGIALMLVKKKNAGDIIPFGPFLAAGSIISIMWGWELINWYASRFLI